MISSLSLLFFFHATATTDIYTLSLHDALPIFQITLLYSKSVCPSGGDLATISPAITPLAPPRLSTITDRKSTRLNSSHPSISYAVFCLKKKKNTLSNQSTINPHNTLTPLTGTQ